MMSSSRFYQRSRRAIVYETDALFRYTSEAELKFVIEKGVIMSYNPKGTYLTNLFTDDPDVTVKMLALSKLPRYRIGPIPISKKLFSKVKYVGIVTPKGRSRGGAKEYVFTDPIIIDVENLYVYDFKDKRTYRIRLPFIR
ncbi:hypothetical protein [Saccharolobus shibatae]|uniref:Uncharacterized protein n=1 Tax=Saccharolobus shibatae TaxID=2286 RepID=A0A8F5C166_9CREN|nr:hypothetical protein [Saccharolobus shibatae]QXJ35091.1 hypothetical protein J5U22_01638 [Saccharolobus shibatae]